MALNLRKIAAARSGSNEGQAASPSGGRGTPPPSWHGRSAPPPVGSSWSDFLDWASRGCIETEEDTALAMRLWRGLEAPDDASAPSP